MDSKSGKSWVFGLGRGPAGTTGPLPLERMRKGGEPGTRGCILSPPGKQNENSGFVPFAQISWHLGLSRLRLLDRVVGCRFRIEWYTNTRVNGNTKGEKWTAGLSLSLFVPL